MRTRDASALLLSLALLLAPAAGQAQVHFGGQLNVAEDHDFGLGPRVVVGVPEYSGVEGVGTFDVFFPDGDTDYWELNGNLVYNFVVPDAPSFHPYAGGGLNIAHVDPGPVGDSRTDVGLNLLGGVKFPLTGFTPFVEIRIEIDGGDQQPVLTGGLLFP